MIVEKLPEKIKALIQKGEGIDIEFKTAKFELSRDTFDSICAFLNRNGGHLLLGVNDNGKIEGVIEDCIDAMVDNIITNANNPKKLNPTYYLSPKVYEDENGNRIIYVFVPEGSQVHQTNLKIFDRNEDGDFDVTNNQDHIAQLYLRKKNTYSENKIYPFVTLDDFVDELFPRIRALAGNQRPDHIWLEMSNEELLKSASLYRKDFSTGEEGYTLASVLLLGKDEVIHSVLPHYKTDAILRQVNTDRYDDRDDIRTNLVESYDRLMAFVRKHLADNFYQENDQRISLRDKIFREVVANTLIHREYSNPFPSKFIIEKEQVVAENWNRPHGVGNIDPFFFSPYPKNPVIAKFFKEIGRAEELGSGIRNTLKYSDIYTKGRKPEFIEGDIFRTLVPVPFISSNEKTANIKIEGVKGTVEGTVKGAIEGVSEGVKDKLVDLLVKIIENEGERVPFFVELTGIPYKTLEGYISKLRKAKLIKFSESEAPQIGGYYITEELKEKITK